MAQPLDDIQYTVTITDQNGCQDVETVDIQVVDDFSLVIPNLITPNDDGYNDTWQIENIIFYEGCQVRIFDRWGTEVFSSSDYQNDWDGTSNDGGELSEGTYYYVIDCENGEKIYKGSVSILK
jgi:gliding motility-associated-like protein